MEQTIERQVFITTSDASRSEYCEQLGRGAWITLVENKGAFCVSCADLDHLMFLPSGDAALTLRARKYSTLVAVVLKWSRACKQYERQGLLVQAQALEQAEQEYLFRLRNERTARHELIAANGKRSWISNMWRALPPVCASCSRAVLQGET